MLVQTAFRLTGGQTITASGTGYTIGNKLTLVLDDGELVPGGSPAIVKVATIDAVGAVLTVVIDDPGTYKKLPTSPVGTTGGTGTGVTITPEWKPTYWEFTGQLPELTFTTQPSQTEINTSISPAVVVSAVNNAGAVFTAYADSVTLAIGNNPGTPSPGTLSGTLTKTAVAGVATFSDLQINNSGVGYTLVASAYDLVNATSASFTVTGPKATGGTVTTSGAYTIHTFTESGTFSVLQAPVLIDYLIVGGGGGRRFGGGGAGGLSYVTGHTITSTGDITITIGAAGVSGSGATNGGTTTFITSVVGGGKGGTQGEVGYTGACGGGGGAPDVGDGTFAGGSATVGYAGGSGTYNEAGNFDCSGGGGGMGAAGVDAALPAQTGNGGIGVSNSISGAAVWYCGGGAGIANIAGATNGQGQEGPGGGGGYTGTFQPARDGIVIIQYLT